MPGSVATNCSVVLAKRGSIGRRNIKSSSFSGDFRLRPEGSDRPIGLSGDRDRWFADSPLEEGGFELLVPLANNSRSGAIDHLSPLAPTFPGLVGPVRRG